LFSIFCLFRNPPRRLFSSISADGSSEVEAVEFATCHRTQAAMKAAMEGRNQGCDLIRCACGAAAVALRLTWINPNRGLLPEYYA